MAGLVAAMNAARQEFETGLMTQQLSSLQMLHAATNRALRLPARALNRDHTGTGRTPSGMTTLVTLMSTGKDTATDITASMWR